jgi:hypothetical protein
MLGVLEAFEQHLVSEAAHKWPELLPQQQPNLHWTQPGGHNQQQQRQHPDQQEVLQGLQQMPRPHCWQHKQVVEPTGQPCAAPCASPPVEQQQQQEAVHDCECKEGISNTSSIAHPPKHPQTPEEAPPTQAPTGTGTVAHATLQQPAAAAATAAAAAAAAAVPPCIHTTFSELQQQLPHSKGLNLLWGIAQQVHGSNADPAAVEVGPILLLWLHPATLQDCRDSLRTDSPAQIGETLLLLLELQQLLRQPVAQQVLGQEQQQLLLAVISGLVIDCRDQLQGITSPETSSLGQGGGGPGLQGSPARQTVVRSADSLTPGVECCSLASFVSSVLKALPLPALRALCADQGGQ